MEILFILSICGLLILTFINIVWFCLLNETVKAMSNIHECVMANADLSKTIATEIIKQKMLENNKDQE